MATLDGSGRPPIGRYTLLPSAFSWENVAEERQDDLSPAQGRYSSMLSSQLVTDCKIEFLHEKKEFIKLNKNSVLRIFLSRIEPV